MSNANPFAAAKATDTVARDFGGYKPFGTDHYQAEIKFCYLTSSKVEGSQSQGVGMILDIGGKTYKEVFWPIGSSGSSTYTDQKSGEQRNIPGFDHVNALLMVTLGKSLTDPSLRVADRPVPFWDQSAGKLVDTQTPCFIDLHGITVGVLMLETIEDKRVKNGQGKWVPSGETTKSNTIDKFVHGGSNATAMELGNYCEAKGVSLPEAVQSIQSMDASYVNDWVSLNQGKVADKSTANKSGGGARPSGGGATKVAEPLDDNPF